MENYSDSARRRLQDNLYLIRQAGGWTAEEFGEKIGVTKQTIGNLENHKTELTKTQYIAIRAVLDYEIKNGSAQSNQVLSKTVHLLLDKENLSNSDTEKVKQAVAFVNGANKSGLDKTVILSGFLVLLGTALASSAFAETIDTWIDKLLNSYK